MAVPSIITTPSWKTTFDLTGAPKIFTFLDTTDYVSAGIVLTGVRGDFKITAPSGTVVYYNTSFGALSDIVADISLTNAIQIQIPNLANQAPEQGVYAIEYRVQIIDGSNPTYYISATNTYNFVYDSPVICIVPQVDCISPLFTVTDATDYVVNAITPTNTRTITLDYPANSGGTPITNTTSATITTSIFFDGLQATTVESDLSYEIVPNIFYITDSVEGTKSINVDCTYVCQLYCCLRTLRNNVENNRGVNNVLFAQYESLFSQAMAEMELLFLAIDCGKQEDANSYIAHIKILANCTDNCSCTDGTPTRVTGLGIQDVNVEVVSGGSPITVVPSVSGGITTYTVSFDQTLVTKINNAYNTVVVNTDGTITVTPTGIIAGVQTYNIKANYVIENRMEFLCRVQYTSPNPTITNSAYLYSGSNINPTVTVVNSTISLLNGATRNNLFTVSGFQIVPNNNYKVTIEPVVMGINGVGLGLPIVVPAASMYLGSGTPFINVLNKLSGQFDFRFAAPFLLFSTITNTGMQTYPDIYINIKISE